MKIYRVVDPLNTEERKQFKDYFKQNPLPSLGMPAQGVVAAATGEKRKPKEGEWYLSGSIPQAYRAASDLAESEYFIATLIPELLPCPFCGEIPTVTKHPQEDLWCLIHRCKVIGPLRLEWSSLKSIVTDWNTRHKP